MVIWLCAIVGAILLFSGCSSGGDMPSDLPLAAVYAAIAYYYDHKDEIDAEIENGRATYEQLKATSPSLVQQKLAALKDE